MSVKNVAVFCHSFEINGANNFIYTLLVGLQSTHTFTVFSPKIGGFAERLAKLNINTQIISINDVKIDSLLLQFDLVIANTLMMSPVILKCVQHDMPHLLVVHETWEPSKIDYYLNELWCIEGVTAEDIKSCLKNARKIVFPANYLASVYEDIVEPHRQSTIYCTIDFEAIDSFIAENKREDIRLMFNVAEDELLFLQVGTVTPRKAQLSTLKAFNHFTKRFPNKPAKLFVVGARSFRPGEKEYIEELNQYILENGIIDRVSIFPVRADIYSFFLAADILVHPSVNEVLPLAILEAVACGVAIIASNLDGIPEALKNGEEAYLINPFDLDDLSNAMERLALDKGIREKLIVNASKRVRSQHASQKFIDDYQKLIKNVRD